MPILTNVLGFTDVSTLTIASGVVTVTQTMHVIAAESATSDDLDTINISADIPTASGSTNFRTYILLRADSGDTITVKHGTGNISLGSGADYVLSGNKTLQLLYTGTAWVDLQSSSAAAGLSGSTGSTDNALLRADGTGGTTVQASGVVVDDSDNVSGVTNLALDSIQFSAATELTIATGAVTITQSVHTIDTEADAASDDLDTISGGATGDVIYLRAANDARTVVLKNGTGNILTYSSSDITLDEDHKVVMLIYNGTNWLEISNTKEGTGGSTSGELMLSAAGGFPSTTSGCTDPTKTEYGTNDVDLYLAAFDQSADEYMQWSVWMPDSWNGGTVTFKAVWTAASGSGDVIWGLQGRAYANDDAIDAAWGTAQTVTDTLTATGDMCYTSTSSAITLAGSPAGGQLVQFRVYRDADAGGDTLSADALLIAVKVYYTTS